MNPDETSPAETNPARTAGETVSAESKDAPPESRDNGLPEDWVTSLRDLTPDAILHEGERHGTPVLALRPDRLLDVCRTAKESLGFDLPDSIHGTDVGDAIEVTYILYSIRDNRTLELKCRTDLDHPSLDSVTPIWSGADWQEREIFDLLGVNFQGHPDLRRLLLPDDFEGYPLRKAYQEVD